MSKIELENIGPVERLEFSLKPGVNVIRGRNDVGKSCTIEAVSRLAGGNGNVTCRDGAVKGHIEGLGVRITAGRSTRRTGELEVLSLESALPVATLVDPQLKDPAAADGKRIKALLALTGAKADPALFYGLCGGKEDFDSLVPPDICQTNDLVELAGRIKRQLEKAARDAEDQAATEDGRALSDRDAGAGLDLTVATDSTLLQKNLEEAAALAGTLNGQAEAAREAKRKAEAARAALQRVNGSADVASRADAAQILEASKGDQAIAEKGIELAREDVSRLEVELKAAKATLGHAFLKKEAADNAVKAAEQTIRQIERNESLAGQWQAAIDAEADVYEPSGEDLEMARANVEFARHAIEQAAVVRQAKERIARAQQHQEAATACRTKADRLREAGRQTDDVLSAAVDSKHLKVRGGRLVTTKEGGKEVYYADRSQGTRWTIALDESVDLIRRLGAEQTAVIAVPQEAFESLDVHNRRLIHEHACRLGVAILTAEAIGEEVKVIPYTPDGDWKARAGELATV